MVDGFGNPATLNEARLLPTWTVRNGDTLSMLAATSTLLLFSMANRTPDVAAVPPQPNQPDSVTPVATGGNDELVQARENPWVDGELAPVSCQTPEPESPLIVPTFAPKTEVKPVVPFLEATRLSGGFP